MNQGAIEHIEGFSMATAALAGPGENELATGEAEVIAYGCEGRQCSPGSLFLPRASRPHARQEQAGMRCDGGKPVLLGLRDRLPQSLLSLISAAKSQACRSQLLEQLRSARIALISQLNCPAEESLRSGQIHPAHRRGPGAGQMLGRTSAQRGHAVVENADLCVVTVRQLKVLPYDNIRALPPHEALRVALMQFTASALRQSFVGNAEHDDVGEA